VRECSSIGCVVGQRVEENVVDSSVRVSGWSKKNSGEYETTIMERGYPEWTHKLRDGLVRKAPRQIRTVEFCIESRRKRWGRGGETVNK